MLRRVQEIEVERSFRAGLGPLMRILVTRVFRKALDGLAHHAFPG